jgi:hypothetical protein
MTLENVFSDLDTVSFSGSRSLSGAGLAALTALFPLIPSKCQIGVGCATGADAAVRNAFTSSTVFAVSSGQFGTGRAAFARRSVAVVEFVPAGGLLVVVPGSVCPPPGVAPSRSFRGGGSGSWGSAALALGTGRRVLLWLPSGATPPVWSSVSWSAIGGEKCGLGVSPSKAPFQDGWWLGSQKSNYHQTSLF